MKIQHVMTAVLAVGMGACAVQPESASEGGTAQAVQAVVAAPSTGSSAAQAAPKAKAAAPRRVSNGPARTALTGPPTVKALPPTAPPTFDTAAAAATASLGDLASLVATGGGTSRGFASAAEVTSSTLADGLPLQFVGLSSLTAFTRGNDTKALAFDTQQVLYPITVGGTVRSSVTVQKGADGKWQAARFGRASIARDSQAIRLKVAAARAVDSGTLSLIEIPTVHAYLLSHTEKGVHMVTPLLDIPGTSYTAGVTQPAAQVFAALQPLAASLDPSAPN